MTRWTVRPRSRARFALMAVTLVALTLSGCTASSTASAPTQSTPTATGTAPAGVLLPPVAGQVDYQLGASYPPPAGTAVVVRDRAAPPVPDAYNVCYLNALQAQPEELDWWLAEHPDLLLRDVAGDLVIDDEWDEALFDVSTPAKREALLAIQQPWIAGCAADGFDAIEPDNQDSPTRSGGLLTDADAHTYLLSFTEQAHAAGLAVAQKNQGPELGAVGRDQIGFDFAIAEECALWDECQTYVDVYGPLIIEIEYTDQPASAFTATCAAYAGHHSIVRRDRQLTAPGDADYSYAVC